jgi:hypothetical protein
LEPLLTLADQWKNLHQASLEAEIANAQRSLGSLSAPSGNFLLKP